MRAGTRAAVRTLVLAVVLAVVGLVVPDSDVAPTQVELVDVRRAQGVDVHPDVVWILAVGSDARPGEVMTRTRGDALQLVGIDTRTGAAAAIGIPRDSYVQIPGYGGNRVNAAMVFGGPQLLGRAVGDLVGIRPDYVMVTRFEFFVRMVNEIGPIPVSNPRPFDDPNLKKRGFRAGELRLGGYDSLVFSRIRKSLPGGDFDRSRNQQRVLRGIQKRIRSQQAVPGFLERGALTVLQHTSTSLGAAEVFRIARAIAAVDPGRVTTCLVPGRIGSVGGASVVLPDRARARRLGAAARDDATLPRGC